MGDRSPLWIRLAVLMMLTPLGILVAGTAWGEWGTLDFSNPEMRQKIAATSSNVAPPVHSPRDWNGGQRYGALPFRSTRLLSFAVPLSDM